MAVRKTDTEYGGRGGVLPPEEFQLTADLDARDQAMLDRQVNPASVTDDREAARRRLEARAGKNDRVGKKL